MKAICIDNSFRESDFTLNKIYDVEYIPMCRNSNGSVRTKGHNPCYITKDDNGKMRPISRDRFISIQTIRYNKLNEILK